MNNLPQRKNSLRHPDANYAAEGAYFVTICTHEREHLFGEIINGVMQLSDLGQLAESCWRAIPTHYPTIRLDSAVIMPNHMHGIVILDDSDDEIPLGRVIASYKSAVTRLARQASLNPVTKQPIWQRNFHDRIIRNEREYAYILGYIHTNPERWEQDVFYG